ncbi:uncharacterized protein LOC143534663 isoform X2 [Bidens hawaiensis]|uniref:uncharacterized protein LOC143534663 isoform X2 n=1 Tax=Bidens hawaiensis TaxID=980011 RepID=UPI00404AF6FD
MDELGGARVDNIVNTFRKKRTQTCRRPKPEVQALPENHDHASQSSTPPSDDAGKISSDENAVDANPKRKVFNLNQCATKTEGEISLKSNGGLMDANEGGNDNKLKKVKLKVGGVTRTIQPKTSSGASKNSESFDSSRSRPKLVNDNSDEDNSPALGKKIGLQGIPWKAFSGGGIILGRNDASMGKNSAGKQGEKSDRARKSKWVPKKRVLDGDFIEEEEDDEIRYLEKLKTVRVAAAASRDYDDESDYVEEDLGSDHETEGNKGKKLWKVYPDSPNEIKRETTLTSRQRALLSGRDSASAGTQIEFPNGLPPAPPRKQKEKLTEVEQQLKKAEAAEKRRIQNEKAARESEAEAIRKILGQDSSRKKREDKLKKRQEELAQEKAANAKVLAPSTIRTVIGPTGTTVAFAEDIGLPKIFEPKPTGYPPPREKCAGPSCTNPYKYRDSKTNLPLCSLQCYKAVNASKQP